MLEETGLLDKLGSAVSKTWNIRFIGGLATDYCVLNTVQDALKHDFVVILLVDAVGSINVAAGDGDRAIDAMLSAGAVALHISEVIP